MGHPSTGEGGFAPFTSKVKSPAPSTALRAGSPKKRGRMGHPSLFTHSYGIREDMVLFARSGEADITGSASDQALVRARPAYRCWNVVRQLDSLERAILIHEGARFGRRASAYHGVSDDQV